MKSANNFQCVLRLRHHRQVFYLALLATLVVTAAGCKTSSTPESPEAAAVLIHKQPVTSATHTFNADAPPPDMPPLAPGETAECDSHFLSSASVRGNTRKTDATHAVITISQIKMTLQLAVNIWLPADASQNVKDHETGHRQNSEFYYQSADQLASRLAHAHIGQQLEITGDNLDAAANAALQKVAAQLNDEYNQQLDPEPSQLLYDNITDHARNGSNSQDAVDHVLKNAAVEAPRPMPSSTN